MSKSVLVDLSKCIGCRSCSVACKMWNELPDRSVDAIPASWDVTSRTTADTWTLINSFMVEKDGKTRWRFVKKQCMHCNEPACEAACFTHTFWKTEEGPVIYQPTEWGKDLCVGCRYCMVACPYSVPGFQWKDVFPYVQKCKFCYDRIKFADGLKPACVGACPSGALYYGNRDETLAEAWNRINGDSNYVKHVYGEKEYGGSSWLYISDVPFEKLGFKTNVSEKSIPAYTGDITQWTIPIFVGWAAVLAGVKITNDRRAKSTHDDEEMYEPVNTEK